jgi:hypothetical protein
VNLGTLGREDLRQVSRLHRHRTPGWESARAPWFAAPKVAVSAAVGLVTLALRLVFGANGPTDWDGVQYVVGSNRFDVTHGAPHPPGYWLYVEVGHVVHVVAGLSAAQSLVLVAALASAAAAALTCAAGVAVGGWWLGLAAAGVVASAPVSWFAGSTVSSYSFDALVAALLVLLAVTARPHGAHGVAAVVGLGLATGFRPSILPMFLPLALIAVAASTRGVRRLTMTVGAGVASVAVWFVPMVLEQPGGVRVWLHAWRAESAGAVQTSSIFSTGSGAATNVGTFAAYTLLTVGPVLVLAVAAGVALLVVRVVTGRDAGNAALRIWRDDASATATRPGGPWYQTTPAIVAAAVVPPLAIVNLVQFAKGGYTLSYLPAATIVLLVPAVRLIRHRAPVVRRVSMVVATAAVLAVVGINVQRFVGAPGILPASFATAHPGLWISQARYGAPYIDTSATIRAADAADAAIVSLGKVVQPATDVVVTRWEDDGVAHWRAITYALPRVRAALVIGSTVVYQELGGLLYYDRTVTVDVAPGGHAVFLLPRPTPELLALQRAGLAAPTDLRVVGLRAWRVAPRARLFGITVTARAGPRPLGHGI